MPPPRFKFWTDDEANKLSALFREGKTLREIAVLLNRSYESVRNKHKDQRPLESPQQTPGRLPDPAPEAGGPSLPESWAKERTPLNIDTPGSCLVLGDTHFPMHSKPPIELAIKEGKDNAVSIVLLNGDIMDMFGISPFFREPTRERFRDEIDLTVAALTWMRGQLPHARFIYREGNHEFRLRRYLAGRAPELYDLPSNQLPELLKFEKLGIEWVYDKRLIFLGKLPTVHGHEFRRGAGINAARFAFLRSTCSVLTSHFHHSSMHPQISLDGKFHMSWSVGCACYLHPDYEPYGQANHGFAIVKIANDGAYEVRNRHIRDGRLL